jgi:hypothetical protein
MNSNCQTCNVYLGEGAEGWCEPCYEAYLHEVGYYEHHHYVEEEWATL